MRERPAAWHRALTLSGAMGALLLAGVLGAARMRGAADASLAFREVSAEAGLAFEHSSTPAGQFYMVEIMGSGGALLDYDGDGDLDVYLVQGSPHAAMSSKLFENRHSPTGRLRFVDVTDRAGLRDRSWGMGVAVGDYDNDGDPDMYVTRFGPNSLYRNNGDGTFTDVAGAAGAQDDRWNASAAFLDYDNDGDLDLFVTAYVDFTLKGNKPCYDATGVRDYCLPAAYRPLPDRLYRNEGGGRFTDVTAESGIGSASGAGLGVAATDANGDGRLDIYVANDGTANHLWINGGRGRFEEAGLLSGASFDAAGKAEAGMGIAAADIDDDGDEDLLVTNLAGETNTLYLNDGDGFFEDVTNRVRLSTPSLPFTGFGTAWLDADHDGRLDLFIANGAVSLVDALRRRPFPYEQPNLLLRNEGTAFRDVSRQSGPALTLEEVSRGAASGDVDNDGDVDILVTNNNGPARLLLNDSRRAGHWLTITLQGVQANREAHGAVIRLVQPSGRRLLRRVHTDGSYLSARDRRVHVGIGSPPAVSAVVVQWPGGAEESWVLPGVDRSVSLRQGSGTPTPHRRSGRVLPPSRGAYDSQTRTP